MASRTKILSIQYYDRDGGLDWSIHGSEWSEWYKHQRISKTKEEVAVKIREKFERMLEVALDMEEREIIEILDVPKEPPYVVNLSYSNVRDCRVKEVPRSMYTISPPVGQIVVDGIFAGRTITVNYSRKG